MNVGVFPIQQLDFYFRSRRVTALIVLAPYFDREELATTLAGAIDALPVIGLGRLLHATLISVVSVSPQRVRARIQLLRPPPTLNLVALAAAGKELKRMGIDAEFGAALPLLSLDSAAQPRVAVIPANEIHLEKALRWRVAPARSAA